MFDSIPFDGANYSITKQELEKEFKLIKDEGKIKTGLYVKDSISGIGTLTYIDPTTNIYGALGHEIIESNTLNKIEVRTGSIFESNITSIDRSSKGNAGTKNATSRHGCECVCKLSHGAQIRLAASRRNGHRLGTADRKAVGL